MTTLDWCVLAAAALAPSVVALAWLAVLRYARRGM